MHAVHLTLMRIKFAVENGLDGHGQIWRSGSCKCELSEGLSTDKTRFAIMNADYCISGEPQSIDGRHFFLSNAVE
jgi:hypothetical protein